MLWPLPALMPLVVFAAGFDLPPMNVSVDVAGTPVTIPVSGSVADAASSTVASDTRSFDLHLQAGLAGLQDRITPLLGSEMNQSERCGDRITIENATLLPAAPASQVSVQLHFEKWTCLKLLGKDTARRLIGGNGNVELKLTPAVEEGNTVRLHADVGTIQADGSLGELLRSGSLGNILRQKIAEALLKAVRKSTDLETVLPDSIQPYVRISSVSFGDAGGARLALNLNAQLFIPAQKVTSLLAQLRAH